MKKHNIQKIGIVSFFIITAFIAILFGLYNIVNAGNSLGNMVGGVYGIFGGIGFVYAAADIWES
jgi:uncharacterized membrane protein